MRGNRGQAATELAIFGSIMLIIVGAMLNYGQTLATQQEMQMYAFRRALQLSRARYNDSEAARQVDFTVFKEVYPVSVLDSGVAKSRVSASASIDWESDTGTLTGEDPEDFSTQYWQLGRRMIRNNELIELPKMKVKLKKDETMSGSFLEYALQYITGGWDDRDAYVSAPIEQTLVDKTTIDPVNIKGEYEEEIKENSGFNAQISVRKINRAEESGTLTLLMRSDDKIKKWDDRVIRIYSKPGDIAIREREKTKKERHWETPIK